LCVALFRLCVAPLSHALYGTPIPRPVEDPLNCYPGGRHPSEQGRQVNVM
jgi:hypothetical protein